MVEPVTSPAAPAPPPPPLAPPPPPAPHQASRLTAEAPQAGQLTSGWRILTGLVWALVIVAYVAVWKTSRELGLSTWWLGPFGDPQPAFVTILPFVAPLVMVLLAVNNSRWLPWAGFGAAAVLALIAVVDLAKVPRLAIVELAIAAAGALIAGASFAGRYRRT
jgi:hypothetical protein